MIAAIGVMIAIIVFHKTKKMKSLKYIIKTNTPLLTVGEEIRGKIEIIFEEKPIEDLTLLILQIFNNGNVPIRPDDFEEAINITFESEVEILSAETISTIPSSLKKHAHITLSQNKAILEPLLLNGKDSVTIKLLLTGFDNSMKIAVDARIVDISEIKEENEFTDDFEISLPVLKLHLVLKRTQLLTILGVEITLIFLGLVFPFIYQYLNGR